MTSLVCNEAYSSFNHVCTKNGESAFDAIPNELIKLVSFIFTSCCVVLCTYYVYSQFKNRAASKALALEEVETRSLQLAFLENVTAKLKLHRFNGELHNDLPNSDFDNCDKRTTLMFHRLAGKMYSNSNLEKNIHILTEEANNALTNYLSGDSELTDLKPMITEYCTQVWTRLMTLDLIEEGLLPEQIAGFLTDLKKTTKEVFPPLISRAINAFRSRPKLQEAAYQAIKLSDDPGVYCDEILRVIVEAMRKDPPVTTTKRNHQTVNLGALALSHSIVGPNPNIFNIDRLSKLPAAWTKLPWLPFGGGPHVCPAWRFAKFVAAQFLTILISRYEIKQGTPYKPFRLVKRHSAAL